MAGSSPRIPSTADFEFSRKITTGYMAFIAALALAILTLGKDRYPWTWVFPLLLVSLPSLVAALILEPRSVGRRVPGGDACLGFAYVFGLLPSLLGIALLVSHFLAIGGVVFLLVCLSWAEILRRVGRRSRTGGADVDS